MKTYSLTSPLTLELVKKEIRLQRNNAMFTLAVVLLGFIALVTITASGPNVMSFSADDIRAALFMTVLIPALVVILPLMVGSTAAASERALGVWAWQAAMPVSWWRVIAIKMAVVITAIAIIAGVLPYLLQLATPPDDHALLRIFRDTWPGWFGILCGAIGFYSGALARDDYHGLMISVLPLAFTLLWMWLADPFLMVSPMMYSPIYVEWALALRLLLIALLLASFAGSLLKHQGQRRIKIIAMQAAILIPTVVGLTLWNLVTERFPLLSKDNAHLFINASKFPPPYSLPKPYKVTSAYSPTDFKQHVNYGTNLQFSSFFSVEPYTYAAGMVGRRYIRNDELFPGRASIFVVGPTPHNIKEFPHAEGDPAGFTKNRQWVWINHHTDAEGICGPLGITISKAMLPDSWFNALRDSLGFIEVETQYSSLGVKESELSPTENDQLVGLNRNYILWKNGKAEIQPGFVALQRATIDTPDGPQSVDNSIAGRRKSGAVIIPFVDDKKVTVSAVLRKAASHNEYKLAGWAAGDAYTASKDYKWATTTLSPLRNSTHSTYLVSSVNESATDQQRTTWEIPTTQPADDGSSVSIYWIHDDVPVLDDLDQQYTWFGYSKYDTITWNNEPIAVPFIVEFGLMFLNLESGEKHFVPAPMPWPAQGSLILQNSPIVQFQRYAIYPPRYSWNQATGQLMMVSDNYLGYTTLRDGNWKDGLNIQYANVPGFEEGIFLSDKDFLATDGAHIWAIRLPQLAP